MSDKNDLVNNDIELDLVKQVNESLYGPKWCVHCNTLQPMIIYKLQGSDFTRMEDTTLTIGFTGAYLCAICRKSPNEKETI